MALMILMCFISILHGFPDLISIRKNCLVSIGKGQQYQRALIFKTLKQRCLYWCLCLSHPSQRIDSHIAWYPTNIKIEGKNQCYPNIISSNIQTSQTWIIPKYIPNRGFPKMGVPLDHLFEKGFHYIPSTWGYLHVGKPTAGSLVQWPNDLPMFPCDYGMVHFSKVAVPLNWFCTLYAIGENIWHGK